MSNSADGKSFVGVKPENLQKVETATCTLGNLKKRTPVLKKPAACVPSVAMNDSGEQVEEKPTASIPGEATTTKFVEWDTHKYREIKKKALADFMDSQMAARFIISDI